jgi:hypothetical protein
MLRRATKIAAVLAGLVVLTELFSYATLKVLAFRDAQKPSSEASLPVYKDRPWAGAYWREHKVVLDSLFENYPYGLWRSLPFKGNAINIDERGMRRTLYSKCDGETPSIWIFGGSTTFGQGSRDDDTIASLLAKRFADAGQQRCVLNFGADAWTSNESIIKLVAELKRPDVKRPGAVLFFDSCNDTFTPFAHTGRVEIPYNFNKEWLDSLAVIHKGSFYYVTATNTWSLAKRLVKRARGGATFEIPQNPDRLAREIADNYFNNIRIVDGLSRSFGFQYAFFWLPLFTDELPETMKVANSLTQPIIHAQRNDRLHDLTGKYDRSLAVDACHLLPEGHDFVAKAAFDALSKDLTKR